MFRRNVITFVLLVLIVQFTFGVYLLGQRRGGGSRADFYHHVSHFGTVLEIVRERYVDDSVDYESLTRAAINGMLNSLDPHSELLIASKFEDLRSHTAQEYGGIGVQIERRDDRITVIAPIAGTPGEEAGIMPGDQIIRVDGKNTERMNLDEIVQLLRGKPRTSVTITLHRPQSGEILEKTITRQVIQVDSVRDTRMLEDGIGYVRITQFGERTGKELAAALDQLETEGLRALVLDLRNNPGGLLTASVDVAEQFFNRGELIVYTQGRDERSRWESRAGRGARGFNYPLAVLINSGSASASEIVAGALSDTRRAVLVGETSFGKGSVQSIEQLRNGEALRLTTAFYHTPAGKVIHERGVEPDIVIELPFEEEVNLRLQRNRPATETAAEFEERFGFPRVEDRQLEAAVEALRGTFLFSEKHQNDRRLAEVPGAEAALP